MIDYKELLRSMCAVMSVSGREKRAARELLPLVEKYFDSADADGVGNVILLKKCGREEAPRIMLDAHFDEVGMAVSEIRDGGFVKVAPVGGIDCSILSSAEAVIYGKEPVYGVFSVTPPHLMKKEDEGKKPTFDTLRIDTGYEKDELMKLISVGDPVGYRASGCDLSEDVIAGRSFDDKSCAAALVCAAADAPAEELAGDVYVVLSSREEVGGGGASCAAAAIDPDFAIVTDVNFARTPGVDPKESGKRGGGPMISLSAVTCRRLTDQVIGIAEKNDVPFTAVVESSNTGTNATSLVLTGDGVPTAVVSIPVGGMHTYSETLSLSDARRFTELIGAVIRDRGVAEEWRDARRPERGVFDRVYEGKTAPRNEKAGLSSLRGTALLEKLSLTFGPSGCEDPVADVITEIVSPYADEVIRDRSGSVIAVLRGTGESSGVRRMMFSAHMDEVGFMVASVEDDGTLKMAPLSARDPKILCGQYVTVGDGTRQVCGCVGMIPIHLSKNKELPQYGELYVDVGASDREEAERIVRKGDYGTFRSDFVRFGQDGRMIKGKAIDDRLGCAVLCDTLRSVAESGKRLPFDTYFAFTCREELGVSGAACAANLIRPSHAVVFESTAVADVDGTPGTQKVARQGMGGALSLADRGTVYDREFAEFILDTAEKNGIPCQVKKFVSGGNDSSKIQRSGEGVRVAAISAPSRYIHTASNVIREEDFFSIERLAEAVLRALR